MFTSTDNNGLLNDYGFQEAKARRERMLQRAQYDYGTSELNRQLSRGMLDIGQKYSKGMEPQVTQFTGRGLGRSGIFQRAMKDYVESQQREVGDLVGGAQSAMGQLNLGEQAAGVSLQDELDRIQRAKYSEILNAAAELKGFAPYAALYSGS
jgi:hypothetical protein